MEDPNFYLEGIVHEKEELKDFEGPLSLILMLLQKNKIEIRDISVSDILDQYLEYLDKMQKLDLEVTSEFVRMASYLLYIKTKMLLTEEEEISELETLIQSLEQLQCRDKLAALKEIVPELGERYKTGALLYSKPAESLPSEASLYRRTHEPVELLQALMNAFHSGNEKTVDLQQITTAMPRRIVYSIRTKTGHILERLKLRDISLNALYSECHSKSELVATFISVLELCSMGAVVYSVTRDGSGYDLAFSGGDIEEIMERLVD